MNEIVNGRQAVTPDTALRFARLTGTEPEFWLNLQQAVDLWDAMNSAEAPDIAKIRPASELRDRPPVLRERAEGVYPTDRDSKRARRRARS